MKLLERFEMDFFKAIKNIKFQKINCKFRAKHNSDIKDIKSSRKVLTPADKYKQPLHNSTTKACKKSIFQLH